jgi:YfiH family protein
VIGLDLRRTVCARQVHGTVTSVVTEQHAGSGAAAPETALPSTDGLATAEVALPLAIFCADCAPILLYDPINRVSCALHAGWRSTVAGISSQAVETLRSVFGTDPARLLVGIGPAIGACCYQVGDEVIEAWCIRRVDRKGLAVRRSTHGWHFDLVLANRLTLESAGVTPHHIEVAGICTRCRCDEWFSHRAACAGLAHPGHFAAIIAVPVA